MVRNSAPLERIERVLRKKRKSNPSGFSNDTPLQKDKNSLNEGILNLYKKDISAIEQESMNNTTPTSSNKSFEVDDDDMPHKRIQKRRLNSNTLETLNDSSPKKSKDIQDTDKSKLPSKGRVKKASDFVLKDSVVTLADVGGLDAIIKDILAKFIPFKNPEVFTTLGALPVRALLFHGPPGCGKTHLARAIAGEVKMPYIEVAATELVCGISGESESRMREMFNEAVKNAPCILFIDEIDVISPKRETSERGMEKRIVSQLLKCLDELNEKNTLNIMVIAATNKPDFIDPALRRGGRFGTEFAFGMPDEDSRYMILQVLSRKLRLSPEFDMKWLAHNTPGYVGADMNILINEAVTVCIERLFKNHFKNCLEIKEGNIGFNRETISLWLKSENKVPPEELENVFIEFQDFEAALKKVVPCSKREGFAMVPDVSWDDVGALKDIKETLQQSLLWPVKYREYFDENGVSSTKGILLYGPKGCGKTLLAKAIANECSINFLSVKGPELLGMYVGESEKKVRECFQRAKHSAPCIIFFDEFDALCPKRSGSNTNAVAERVVNQLLTEMDGIGTSNGVFVIGATNLLKKIDSAVLRPGRIEKIIKVGLPSPEDRVDILKSLTKNKTKPKISDDVDLKVIAFDPRCENFSGADLAYLVNESFYRALNDHISSSHSFEDVILEIKLDHFEYALNIVKPSVSLEDIM